MANVLHRVTRKYLRSVNTPKFSPAEYIINPDLSTLKGLAPFFSKGVGQNAGDPIVGDVLEPWSQAELDAYNNPKLAEQAKSRLLGPNGASNAVQEFFDDFFGGVNTQIWDPTTGAGTVSPLRPGEVRLESPAVAGQAAVLITRNMQVQGPRFLDLGFRIAEVTAGNQRISIGLFADANNYLVFRRQNGGNWIADANKGGTSTTVDTGFGAIAGYNVFLMEKSRGNAVFKINGRDAGTIAGNDLPSGPLEFIVRLDSLAGVSAVRHLDLDAVRLHVQRP